MVVLTLGISAPAILLQWMARRAAYVVGKAHMAAAAGCLYLCLAVGAALLLRTLGWLGAESALAVLGVASIPPTVGLLLLLRPRGTVSPDRALLESVREAHWRYGRFAAGSGLLLHLLFRGQAAPQTLLLLGVLVALLVSVPVGVAAAIYLSEYARDTWFTRVINVAIVNLAGVPSIVHALFGVAAFVHFLQFGKSILAASCTLAVMTLPVIIVATRESLQAVPRAFRDACWSMGATRWHH